MEKTKIKIETVPNGYTLDIGGKGYMYFNTQELLAGILVHLGLGEKEPMTNEELLNVLFDAMLGTKHCERIENMREHILQLENEYKDKLEIVRKTTLRLREYENMAVELEKRLKSDREEIRRTEEEYKEGKTLAYELLKGVDSLQSKTNTLKEELKTTRELLREIKNLNKNKDTNIKTPQDRAAAYDKKKIKKGSITEYPDAGVIIHHTK